MDERERLFQLLAEAEFFTGLERRGLERVLEEARQKRLERQEICFRQDEPATLLYLLTEGRVKLTQLTPDGRQVLMRFVEPGEVFGGIALFTQEEYPVTAEAVERCRLLAWDGAAMQRLMEKEPKIALNVIQHLAELVKNLQDRVRELSTERVERRIARALLRLAAQAGPAAEGEASAGRLPTGSGGTGRRPESGEAMGAVIHVSRQDLGELTGATLYTVSRTLSRWESEGLVESGRERITILDPRALAAIAEDET